MRPSEKRKAKAQADELRHELRRLEIRLARFPKEGTIAATTQTAITEVKRKLTALNFK